MIQRQFPARAVILICPYLVKPSTFPSIFKRRERWNCYNNEIKGFFISSLSLRFCESDEINTQHESLIDWIMELIMDNIYIFFFVMEKSMVPYILFDLVTISNSDDNRYFVIFLFIATFWKIRFFVLFFIEPVMWIFIFKCLRNYSLYEWIILSFRIRIL